MLHQGVEKGGVALVAGEDLVIQTADILTAKALEENDDDVLSREARISR
jgi:hypothetical protein